MLDKVQDETSRQFAAVENSSPFVLQRVRPFPQNPATWANHADTIAAERNIHFLAAEIRAISADARNHPEGYLLEENWSELRSTKEELLVLVQWLEERAGK